MSVSKSYLSYDNTWYNDEGQSNDCQCCSENVSDELDNNGNCPSCIQWLNEPLPRKEFWDILMNERQATNEAIDELRKSIDKIIHKKLVDILTAKLEGTYNNESSRYKYR